MLACLALTAPLAAQEALGIRFVDDRSSAERVIVSYYNAINLGQYARAYGYYIGGPDNGASYEEFKKGFADTSAVVLQMGQSTADPGAGNDRWLVPVAIQSVSTDGKATVYAGCYTINKPADGVQYDVVPYTSYGIDSAHLSRSDKPLGSALPESCD